MKGSRALAAVVLAAACALGAAACGGGERQDAEAASGGYRLEVVSATFPGKQALADQTRMEIDVKNADSKAVPNVAVTVVTKSGGGGAEHAFSTDIQRTDVADRSRPIWVVDAPPGGGDTAATNTWALGRLEPGQVRRFTWKVTAVRPGTYTVGYTAFPDLTGTAHPEGGGNKGSFKVDVTGRPPGAGVDDAGNVVRESSGE